MVVVAVTLISTLAAHLGWLDGFETPGLDALLSLPRIHAQHVSVVEIVDADYEKLFDGRSPLDPERLRAVLTAIARGRPRLVAVDLETDPNLIAAAPAPADDSIKWPPTVWAAPLDHAAHDGHATVYRGVAAFPTDRDGVIRRYQRRIALHGQPAADSFPWAIVQVFCDDGGPKGCAHLADSSADAEFLLNFAGDRYEYARLTAADLLEASTGAAWDTERGPLFGRIVLLGGVYTAAREMRFTPLGSMPGVYLVAHAVETELQGGGIRAMNELLMVLFDIVGGVALVALHRWSTSVPLAFWSSVVGMPVLALVSSGLAFFTFSRWASFAPTFLGVLIHQLYEGAKQAQPPRSGASRH